MLLGVVLGDLGVEVEEVFMGPSEELELELVIDFGDGVHPVHCSYKYIATITLKIDPKRDLINFRYRKTFDYISGQFF